MSDDKTERLEALKVIVLNVAAVWRGKLPCWTIYYDPLDHPGAWIARLHEAGADGSIATENTVEGDFTMLRRIFERAGLTRLSRSNADDLPIVENWM